MRGGIHTTEISPLEAFSEIWADIGCMVPRKRNEKRAERSKNDYTS
jgi:hypothetical protein